MIRDLDTGEQLQTICWKSAAEDKDYFEIACGTVSEDGSYAAFVLSGFGDAVLLVADLHTGEICFEDDVTRELSYYYSGYRLIFTEQNDLVMAHDSEIQDADIRLYDAQNGWQMQYAAEVETEGNTYVVGTTTYWEGGINLLTCSDGYVIFADYKDVYYLEEATGEVAANIQLPAAISSAAPTDSGRVGVILQNGLITVCYPNGQTGADMRSLYYECGYDVCASAICGETFRKGTFAVVPRENQSNIAVLREAENPRMEEVVSMDDFPLFSACFVSPSGKLAAMVGVEYENAEDCVAGVLYDRETKEKVQFRFPDDFNASGFTDKNNTVLTDDGRLMSCGRGYDIGKGTLFWLSDTGDKPENHSVFLPIYTQGAADGGTTIYTVQKLETEDSLEADREFCIWKDTEELATIECPETEIKASDYHCLQIAGDTILFQGTKFNLEAYNYCYLIYSISEGKFTTLKIPETLKLRDYSGACFTLSQDGALLAVMDGNQICLYDTKTGEVSDSIPHEWYEASFCKLQFAIDDTLLFGFTNDSRILVYDVKAGKCLARVDLDSGTYSFSERVNYSFYEITDQNRILLVVQSTNQRLGIILRRSDWTVVGLHEGIVDFRDESRELLVYPYVRGLYRGRLLNGDEIIEIGREYLEDGNVKAGKSENDKAEEDKSENNKAEEDKTEAKRRTEK